MSTEKKRLTQYASCSGCAAKMSLGDLAHVLNHLGENKNTDAQQKLIVGFENFDDAGVFRLDRDRALVQTVDFFPPIVDEPRWFGRIAAANALSDVYAMGGRPLTVLNIAGFPVDFDPDTIREILLGAAEKVHEAGAVIAGGHTIRSVDVLFGLSVTGEVHPEQITANTNAKPGDLLYLTKPLGMGAASTAIKKEMLDVSSINAAHAQMATLNAKACEAMVAAGTRCATDITGYGILGHARNIARASKVTLQMETGKLPFFPTSIELAQQGLLSGGAAKNRKSFSDDVQVAASAAKHLVDLCFDSETSGGLLIALNKTNAEQLESELTSRGVPVACIGKVLHRNQHPIELS